MNRAEFEILFRNHFAPLTNIAYSYVRDKDTACDIVQHVFIKLWDNLDKIQITSSEKSYLHRAVINTSLNFIEKNKRITYHDDVVGFENLISIETSENDQDEKDKELNKKIYEAIDELPPKCREVFTLSRIDGMKNQEIADSLNISLKTVEKHMGKALKYLRTRLKNIGCICLTLLMNLFFYLR
jgi:RNA polymerase sigma-70 factor, ECF subfamily